LKPVNGSVPPDDWRPLELPEVPVAPLVELLVPEVEPELEPDEEEEPEEDVGAELEEEPELPELCPEPEVLEPLSGSTYCWSPAEVPEPWASAALGAGNAREPINTMHAHT
jgi:hypothetical protein